MRDPVGPSTIQRYKANLDSVGAEIKSKFATDLAAWTQRYPTQELQQHYLATKPVLAENNPNMPSRLYNGMVHGLEPYSLEGFLWFQGDGNFGNPQEYGELVKTLIRAWRSHWHDDPLPFWQDRRAGNRAVERHGFQARRGPLRVGFQSAPQRGEQRGPAAAAIPQGHGKRKVIAARTRVLHKELLAA